MFQQALRMTLRDWRTGELRFLLIALIVAVAALSSVGFRAMLRARCCPRSRR